MSLLLPAPALFKDHGKNANDLLNKGYPSTDRYNLRVELDQLTAVGPQVLANVQSNYNGSVDAELKAKARVNPVTVTASVNNKQNATLELAALATYSNGLIKPTLTVSTLIDNSVERAKVKLYNETRHARLLNFTASCELPVAYALAAKDSAPEARSPYALPPKTILNGVVNVLDTGAYIGGEVEMVESSLKASSAVLSVSRYTSEFTLYSKRRDNVVVGATFFQRVLSPFYKNTAVAAEISHDFVQSPTLSIGAQYNPLDDVTLKARMNSVGLVGVNVTQRNCGPFAVSAFAELNALDTKRESALAYGFKLAL